MGTVSSMMVDGARTQALERATSRADIDFGENCEFGSQKTLL